MTSVLSFILVLGVLIFVHELGHFLLAKACGVRVLTFSLGFGNRLLSRKWGETDYVISAFPLGGYVKMYGEHSEEEVAPANQVYSFSHKPVWQRFLIVAAGPAFNMFFAFLLFAAMHVFVGIPEAQDTTAIGKVSENSAAQKAGIQVNDRVLSINGEQTHSWADISRLISESGGKTVELVLQRQASEVRLLATPERKKIVLDEGVEERYILGITRSKNLIYQPIGLGESLRLAATETWQITRLTGEYLIKMVQRIIPASELGGPLLIAEIAGKQMEAGWMNFLYFMAALSINLGVLNLLPVPVLDGGHLVLLSLEGIRRKPLGDGAMLGLQKVGIALLGSLMIFVFYNDIARIVSRWLAN